MKREWLSGSPAATKRIGREIAALLKSGDVVAISGELGSGKTTLVKGIAKALGVRSEKLVISPTFVLIQEYKGRMPIFHMDWYRLDSLKGADRDLVDETLNRGGVTLIEWPERAREALPENCLLITLRHAGPKTRKIELKKRKIAR